MNDKQFQQTFDHFIKLSQQPSQTADECLFMETFRTLVTERSQHLAVYKRLEAVISKAGQEQQELLGTARGQFKVIGELTDASMKREVEVEQLKKQLADKDAESQDWQKRAAQRATLFEEAAAQVRQLQDSGSEDTSAIDAMHEDLTNAEQENERLRQTITSANREISDLEDEKAILSDKLTAAENRITQFLSVGKR